MLTLSYGCGLRASEVVRLRAGDIDSEQMIIRIVQSKGRGGPSRARPGGYGGFQARVSQFQRIRLGRFLAATPGSHSVLRFNSLPSTAVPQDTTRIRRLLSPQQIWRRPGGQRPHQQRRRQAKARRAREVSYVGRGGKLLVIEILQREVMGVSHYLP